MERSVTTPLSKHCSSYIKSLWLLDACQTVIQCWAAEPFFFFTLSAVEFCCHSAMHTGDHFLVYICCWVLLSMTERAMLAGHFLVYTESKQDTTTHWFNPTHFLSPFLFGRIFNKLSPTLKYKNPNQKTKKKPSFHT